jgi:flagellar biosynthetic protein FliR
MWPFFRIGALCMAAPVFGSHSVPVRIRLVMALAITLVVAPLLPAVPRIDPFSLSAVGLIFQQLLIGVAMGFALQLVFSAIITGGQVIAMQMGLGFASMVDPQNGQQVPVLSQFYLMMATLLFLGFNGHLALIELLVDSFELVPIANDGLTRNGLWVLVSWGSQMFAGAVWLALPAMAALLVVNIAFGVMARAAPQLNIFAIGFPVAMIMGFIVVFLVLPSVVPQFTSLVDQIFRLMGRMLTGGA